MRLFRAGAASGRACRVEGRSPPILTGVLMTPRRGLRLVATDSYRWQFAT
jgi:hypothetical protein